jgi:hypothetical protein
LLSYDYDVELLNSVMALEGGDRSACPLLSLPLDERRKNKVGTGQELKSFLDDIRAGRTRACTQFSDICDLYDARNDIVHGGRLPADRKRPDTWFIAALLLRPVLTWFSEHPDAELDRLDAEISAL